ncbi:UDP-glycosyltransferase UGT5-like [Episyrphus balteatus]|uniref:UDP-glycosyltransferase UGT5-like n=1 Tax=Episyrphus balteatus TaxID=286459 RepID=UPI0024859A63|nr:UDP-glycosyltransferase UGT5-like [Episyrphus balteatus]
MNLSSKFVAFALFCIAFNLNKVHPSRILGLFPTHSRSHLIIHKAIAEALAERGHNVTVVSNHAPIKKTLHFRYIFLDVPTISENIFSESIDKRRPFHETLTLFIEANSRISNASLNHPLMKKLMKEESFDLVLLGYFMNDFLFGVAAHFKCPLILSVTVRPVSTVNDFVGNPQEFAYVPKTMMKNVSLVFTAHHFSQGPVRPDVPAMVEIGGIQIKDKRDPLPEDIQKILDNSSQNGAIYFSLGTNVYKNHLDPLKVKTMFKALSKLPQTILCKWSDEEHPLEAPNIFYRKWLPQVDVLSHSNIKLFVTHGGLGGIIEAKYHGVPMVGIPLFNDQYSNMEGVQNSGFGLNLEYATLTEKIMRNAIKEVLSNKTYLENVRKFSRIYKDRPMTAKQTAVYWAEYVIRHHGAAHLQSPAIHMNTIQLMSLDVIGFLLSVLYLIMKAMGIVLSCFKVMFSRNKTKKE